MRAKRLLQAALLYKGWSMSELARVLGMSPQLLHKRVNTSKFTLEEWAQIGAVMGATATLVFEFENGKEIK